MGPPRRPILGPSQRSVTNGTASLQPEVLSSDRVGNRAATAAPRQSRSAAPLDLPGPHHDRDSRCIAVHRALSWNSLARFRSE